MRRAELLITCRSKAITQSLVCRSKSKDQDELFVANIIISMCKQMSGLCCTVILLLLSIKQYVLLIITRAKDKTIETVCTFIGVLKR
jgi:hypothetical protein